MGLLNYEFNNLNDLFVHLLEDTYDAEHRLIEALPKMADAATNADLKAAFQTHLQETKGQVSRLEQVFKLLGREADRETCDAMKGLVSEGSDAISAKGDKDVRDAALIASAQKAEHYEIASYGTLRTFAKQLGLQQAASLLQQTLDEEERTDKKLTSLAEGHINAQAT